MRKDIFEAVERMKKEGIRPNYSELARRYNCDYRTVKKYYTSEGTVSIEKKKQPSELDGYRETIKEKVEAGAPATEICKFIKKKGYLGQYSIVKVYVRELKGEMRKKATIRFETNPGLQAQVDCKERMRLISKNGEVFTVDIFLIILGYSRLKYIELTINKEQDTLFQTMANAFKYFGGVPKEILFDNMRTVIDQSRTRYTKLVINRKFYQFSRDMGFEVKSCMAYRPQTKGKVEALAKVMNRLKVYNKEFEDYYELSDIVREFNEEINLEISQATNQVPWIRYKKEKEYLNPLPNQDILDHFYSRLIVRKVSKESMILYNKSKYSVPTKYIGKLLTIKEDNAILHIYYNKDLIKSHKISNKFYNFDREDIFDILKSDAFSHYSDEDIEKYIDQNISIYDYL